MTRRQPGADLKRLRRMTSAAVWERGEDYAADGGVTLVSVAADRVVARVEGTALYRCTLAGRQLLEMDCTCPAFEDFSGPCKHLVATALTLARRKDDGAPLPSERLRSFLGGLPSERLVELLLEVAEADPELEARLLLQADTATATPSELGKVLRRALAAALDTGDFVDYREMTDWAGRVDAVIDRMEDSVRAGEAQARVVLELVPELIAGLEGAVEHTDDDGHIAMLLERSTGLLGSAALAGRPEPVALARSLVHLDLTSEYAEIGPPSGALAEALGEQGHAAYWAAIEEAWSGLEELRPRERQPEGRSDDDDPRRWRLRDRMLARARAQQDTAAEIAVLAKTLCHAHEYLELAKACHEHGRVAEAAAWIDEALWFFGAPADVQLAREGAPLLAAAGQTERALSLLWEQFTHHPSVESCQDLERLAATVGAAGVWRERACRWLERLRQGEVPEDEQPSLWGRSAQTLAADVLVELALTAGDLERAWEVARASQLSEDVWRQLAEASEAARPADSIQVYQSLAERAVATVKQHGYREAVDLIGVIRRLGEAGDSQAVDAWLAALRARHKAKRSFIAMLDSAKWRRRG